MCVIWIGLVVLVQLPSFTVAVCDGNQFACKTGNGCIEAKQHCDHVIDCSDGSDELECIYPCRSPHMKQCRDGHCIAMYFFCDRENDCGDWSDELNCTGTFPGLTTICPSNTFHCEGQVCIPQNWVCDGMEDCSDARDELHCNKTIECIKGFQCGKECILNQWVCDGVADCADGLDEKECGPDTFMNQNCLPEHGWFRCLSEGTLKCMPISRACDSYADCDDGADEGGQCNSTTNCGSNTRCPNECHKTPRGPVCSCPLGYQLNATACVDVDECNFYPPMCSQKCVNTEGGFECSCSPGYTIGARDKRICVANGGEPMLLITTDRDIRYISLTSKDYGLVQSGISQAHGIAADYEDGFVYWNEKSKDKVGIYKSMLDGSAFRYVVSVGIEMVEDLAIDWVGRHIYFTDSERKHIVVCDFHATICAVVITGQLDKPRAVAVHPEKNLLFWSDCGSKPHIGSAGMDGSKRTNIITTEIVWPNGLVVDETIQRIYWGDAKLNRIESSKMNGSDRKILNVKVTHPYGLDIFENTIFWCDPLEHQVLSANKFTGKDYKVLIKEASLTPTGIHVHQSSKQSHLTDPCSNVICSHLCLLSPSVEGLKCACPLGMNLNKDGRSCDSDFSYQSSIVIATYTDIYRLTHHQIGKDSTVRLPTRDVENIGALAFNPKGHSIVYSDMNQRTIYSMHLDTYRQTILFDDAGMVEGLDVDPFTENIYWTEVTRGIVVIGHKNHDGVYDRLVLARNLHSPKGIIIAPEFGKMFIVEGRISYVISVWHMDGSNRRELVQVYGTVSAMAYDGKHLYFSDSLRGTIERIQVGGENRTILRSHLETPIAIDASKNSVFWLTQFSTRISWLDKQEPKTMRDFVVDASADITVQYRSMSIVDVFDFDSHEHHCLGHSGGCSDICAPSPDGFTCLCPSGKVLAEDQHVCVPVNCVGDLWFTCQNGCIPSKYRCDGVSDCPLGEDELQCRNSKTEVGCSSSQFQCKNGGCVSIHFYCDGNADCHDGSDEPDSCPPYKCLESSDYSCPNQNHCISRSAVCDGQIDCMDKSDEANCTSTRSMCLSTHFLCPQNLLCIPLDWVCDGDSDCGYGEDEDSGVCGRKSTCPLNYLRCPQHSDCMPRMALCNSIAECEHDTDEQLCAKLNDYKNVTTIPQQTTSTTIEPAIVPAFSICHDTNSSAATGKIQSANNSRKKTPCTFEIIAPAGQQIQISCSAFSFTKKRNTLTLIGLTESVWPLPVPNRTYYSVGNTLSVYSKFEATDQFLCQWNTTPKEKTFNFCRHGQSSSAVGTIRPLAADTSALPRHCGFSIMAPRDFQISFKCSAVNFNSNLSSLKVDGTSALFSPLVLSSTTNDFKVNTTYYSTAKNELFLTSNLVSGDWVDCNWTTARRENKTNFILCRDGDATAAKGTITPPRNGTVSLDCAFSINAPAGRRIEISCPVMSSQGLLQIDGLTKSPINQWTDVVVNETYYSTSQNKVILYAWVNSSDWFSCNWTTVKKENTTNLKLCRDDQGRSTSGTITPLQVYSNHWENCDFSIKSLPDQQIQISCSIFNMNSSLFSITGLNTPQYGVDGDEVVVNRTVYSHPNSTQLLLSSSIGSKDDWFSCSWSILPKAINIFKLCRDRVSTSANGIIQSNGFKRESRGCGFRIGATRNQQIQFSCSALKLSSPRSELTVTQLSMKDLQFGQFRWTPLLNRKYSISGNTILLYAVVAHGDGFSCQWTTNLGGKRTVKSLSQPLPFPN